MNVGGPNPVGAAASLSIKQQPCCSRKNNIPSASKRATPEPFFDR